MNINQGLIRRGNVFMADLDSPTGAELGYRRPVIIIQNDNFIENCPTVLVAVITGRTLRNTSETHIECQYGSKGRILNVMLEHLRTIDKSRLVRYCATLCDDGMLAIDHALRTITSV